MIDAEKPEGFGIGETKVEISALEHDGVLVELSGEFDVRDLEALRRVLGVASSSAWSTYVDLSGVTFLDVRCARELAARSRFRNPVMLCDPSWQAAASFRVCGREAPVVYRFRGKPPREEQPGRTDARRRPAAAQKPEAWAV